MPEQQKVYIAGGTTTPFDYPVNLQIEEMVANTIRQLYKDVPEFHLKDVREHGMVVYSHFSVHFAHQLTSYWILHDHLGLVGVPHFRIDNGGNTGGSALYAAYALVRAGLADIVPVIGYELMGSVSQSKGSEFIAIASDTRYEAMLGANYTNYYAGLARVFMEKYGLTEEDFAKIAVKNKNNSLATGEKAQHFRKVGKKMTVDDIMTSRLISYPLKKWDCCFMSEGAATILVCNEQFAKQYAPDQYVEIAGAGLSSCTIRAGDRYAFPGWTERYGEGYPGLGEFAACRHSAEVAFKMAGIEWKDSYKYLDVAEVHDAFSTSEFQIYNALGWCDSITPKQFIHDRMPMMEGEIPTNPGGGLIGYGHPVGATGLMSAIECYYQLAGLIPREHRSTENEVKDAKVGLVNSHAGTGTSISNFVLKRV
ncbi:MAG: thiolase C-terminal domain-containing protein [Candidatus Hodarchaeales archaeon]|jgi:acetyl-CoA C-acetyltransferase